MAAFGIDRLEFLRVFLLRESPMCQEVRFENVLRYLRTLITGPWHKCYYSPWQKVPPSDI